MPKRVAIVVVLVCALTGVLGLPVADAGAEEQRTAGFRHIEALPQVSADLSATASAVAEAAIELSVLESERDFDALYDRLHPDSRSLVPFAAFEGWYQAELAGKQPDELKITAINFIDWIWGVTGQAYPGTAQVQFVQPYQVDGVRTEVEGVFHLVESDGEWYWFFGASREFIDQQIARYAPVGETPEAIVAAGSAERARRFPDILHAHVDAYWAYQFAAAEREYNSPGGVVGFDQPIETGCGRADPITEAAFYCVLDRTIYYSVDFRELVERQIGDYGWVAVVAHEWGHHVQLELGADLVGALDQSGGKAPIELEQQADCLAGAYTLGAEQDGWLDFTDVDEAVYMTGLSGDPPGTNWDDPHAHGTGEDRIDAFMEGYTGGIAACELNL